MSCTINRDSSPLCQKIIYLSHLAVFAIVLVIYLTVGRIFEDREWGKSFKRVTVLTPGLLPKMSKKCNSPGMFLPIFRKFAKNRKISNRPGVSTVHFGHNPNPGLNRMSVGRATCIM